MNALSIVIPIFKSAKILPVLFSRLEKLAERYPDGFEVIAVNDNGEDESWDYLLKASQHHPWLRSICLSRNYGQHNALLCGIRMARYPVTVTMDDDLQHSPESIASLTSKLEEGYDLIYGYPRDEQHSFLRKTASWLTKVTLARVMGADAARHISAFRAFRTDLREAFSLYSGTTVSIDVLLTWGGERFGTVIVDHEKRFAGTSNYNFRKLVRHALNMITGFSLLPLKIASGLGLVAIALGILILTYVMATYVFVGGRYPGFTFLAASIAIFSGAQLVALGVLGEYVGRIHLQSLNRPSYTIRATHENEQ